MKSVCRPAKMWIDGKCFNIRTKQNVKRKHQAMNKTIIPVEEYLDLPSDHGFEINPINDAKFCTSFHLPNFYYKKLLNFDLKKLAESTNTVIALPPEEHEENLVITGKDEKSIVEARHEIHTIIHQIRNESRALQFISIPTKGDKIIKNFMEFKERVLQEENIDGLEETIFQKACKLHLTVAVFSLFNENEELEAKRVLEDYKANILTPFIKNNGPLHIEVKGINCMTENHKTTHVLYANAKIVNETEECNLQKFANELSAYYYERGLVQRFEENVKLHVTLMNTKYRKNNSSPKRKRWPKRIPFDARTIMEKYKDFHFGEVEFNSIHLSRISSTGEDGFYQPLAIITF